MSNLEHRHRIRVGYEEAIKEAFESEQFMLIVSYLDKNKNFKTFTFLQDYPFNQSFPINCIGEYCNRYEENDER